MAYRVTKKDWDLAKKYFSGGSPDFTDQLMVYQWYAETRLVFPDLWDEIKPKATDWPKLTRPLQKMRTDNYYLKLAEASYYLMTIAADRVEINSQGIVLCNQPEAAIINPPIPQRRKY